MYFVRHSELIRHIVKMIKKKKSISMEVFILNAGNMKVMNACVQN